MGKNMQIDRSEEYFFELQAIMEYIAQDSFKRALVLRSEFDEKIENLPFMPLKNRQSVYFSDLSVRDLIHKGYVIPYKIDNKNSIITVLGIYKYKNSIK
ncbi:type II toxin-antitoxin system RelE/ParE family toxin [Sulfurospirillum tamanense]|nr:type II toxin-antitoxin system RelE/ParE family toxin [Sulfurospirillum tamanensis]